MDPTPDIFGRAFQHSAKERLLRDPLHGLIAIDENTPEGRLLVRLIDAPELQRLRRIRQLGLAHYAFQGAEHSRFTHSIGAYYLMDQVLGHLGRMYSIDSELAFYARVAALVHDVGHGPFSHVSERIFGVPHERWTVRILHDSQSSLNRILSEHSLSLPSIVESMLTGTARPGYLSSLVGSQLDTDRLDYLLRDSLMTGVKYGIYDLDRLIHMLRISPDGERIIVAAGGLSTVEKYIQARYHMHRQVYLHKTVMAAEAMLAAALRRASELARSGDPRGAEPGSPLARAFTDSEGLSVADYLQLDDVTLLAEMKRWARGADPVLADLSSRMLGRRLYKTLEIDPETPDLEARNGRAADLIARAGGDPDYALLWTESSDTPYAPYDPSSKRTIDQIFIEDGKGKVVDVAELSPTVRAFTESRYTLRRLVFSDRVGETDVREEIESIFAD